MCNAADFSLASASEIIPYCPDSEHSFLDATEDDELLNEIVEEVEDKYDPMSLSLMTYVGYVADYQEFSHNNHNYYVVDDEDLDYPVFKESPYSSYYNVSLIEPVNILAIEDGDLEEKINEIREEMKAE